MHQIAEDFSSEDFSAADLLHPICALGIFSVVIYIKV